MLLDRVFAEAEEYNLRPMETDEFTAHMMADRDPEGQSVKKWSDVLRRMEKDGKVSSRYARNENNRRVKAYRLTE